VEALERHALEGDVAARDARDRGGCLHAGELIACQFDALSGKRVAALDHARGDGGEVGYGELLQWAVRRQRQREAAGGKRVEVPGVECVFHEVDGREDRVRHSELARPLLDRVLAVEHRHARPRLRTRTGGQDEVTDTTGVRRFDCVDAVPSLARRAGLVRAPGDERGVHADGRRP
jgi:hypothetical protein